MDLLYASINILHDIVFRLDLVPVLGRKLVEVARLPGPFNGLTHLFIVTFGRLSWAGVPDWIAKTAKEKYEAVAGEGFFLKTTSK